MTEDLFERRLRRDLDAIADAIPVNPPRPSSSRTSPPRRVPVLRVAVALVAVAVAGAIAVVATGNPLSDDEEVATADEERSRASDPPSTSEVTWVGQELDAQLPGDPAFAATEPGTIIVWGGRDPVTGSLSAEGVRYDLASGTAEPLPPAPIPPRANGLAAGDDGQFVVVGGSQGQASPDTREGLVDGAIFDQSTASWTALPPVSPTAQWLDGVALHDHVVYVVGRDADGSGKLWSYDTANQPESWTEDPPPAIAEDLTVALVDDDSLLLEARNVQRRDVPGAEDFPIPQHRLYRYRFADGTWEDLGELPTSVETPDEDQPRLQVDPAAYLGDAQDLALITHGSAVMRRDPTTENWDPVSSASVPAPCQDGTHIASLYMVWGCGLEGAVSADLTEWASVPPPADGLIIQARSRAPSGLVHVLASRADGRGYVASLEIDGE